MIIDPAFAAVGSAAAKYGSLADMIKGAGFLLAATLTLSLGWMKRSGSSWVPPEEAIPKATTRFASLITTVLLALLYVFLHQPDRTTPLAILTFLSLVFALIGLMVTIFIMKSCGFPTTRRNWHGKEIQTVKLGGSQYTHDANEAIRVQTRTCGPVGARSSGRFNTSIYKSFRSQNSYPRHRDVSGSSGIRLSGAWRSWASHKPR